MNDIQIEKVKSIYNKDKDILFEIKKVNDIRESLYNNNKCVQEYELLRHNLIYNDLIDYKRLNYLIKLPEVKEYIKLVYLCKNLFNKLCSLNKNQDIYDYLITIPFSDTEKIYYRYPQTSSFNGYSYENIENPEDVYTFNNLITSNVFEKKHKIIKSSLDVDADLIDIYHELDEIRDIYLKGLIDGGKKEGIKVLCKYNFYKEKRKESKK